MSDPTTVCQITGHSDIAGIGVRVSVYAQACLVTFNLFFVIHALRKLPEDSQSVMVEAKYSDMAKSLERSLFMAGFAVILSAILEFKTSTTGLSAYHALIVLNVSQINNWAGFLLVLSREMWLHPSEKRGFSKIFRTKKSLISSFPYIAHSTMMSGFGLYFWSDLTPFIGSAAQCRPLVYFWVFGSISVSNGALRIISLIYYSINIVPVFGLYFQGIVAGFIACSFTFAFAVNLAGLIASLIFYFFCLKFLFLLVLIIFEVLLSITFVENMLSPCLAIARQLRGLFPRLHYGASDFFPWGTLKDLWFYISFTLFASAPFLYSIASTELIVHINKPYVEPGAENKWTYGQTLALFTTSLAIVLYVSEFLAILGKGGIYQVSDMPMPQPVSNNTQTGGNA